MIRRVCALLAALLATSSAQADHGDADARETNVPPIVEKLPESVQGVVDNMVESRDPHPRFLRSVLDLPRSRFGSGTSWLPDASPLFAVLPHKGRWGFLGSGNIYLGYNYFSSERGDHRFMGRNLLSFTPFRTFRKSELAARLMISFEPFTIGPDGYPLIAQTGQTSDGEPLVDRQHAFELFRELALMYAHELNTRWALSIYFGLSGEPALGPGAFTHRISANPDPLAPLSFQWLDGTQTSYGVLTVGIFKRTVRMEASWFNGREPNERKYGIDLVRMPDSGAARITWNPIPELSLQTSYGFLRSPERLEPEVSHHRITGSATYSTFGGEPQGLAVMFAAAERVTSRGKSTAAVLLEGHFSIDGHNTIFGRSELVQKTGRDLVLVEGVDDTHTVGTLAAGFVHYFGPYISLEPGVGVRASVTPLPRALEDEYGTRAPLGVMVYAQLRTAALPLDDH